MLTAVAIAGCQAPGAGAPESLAVRSASTAIVHVRIAPFESGRASPAEDAIVAEYFLPPRGSHTFELPAGKYTIEGVAKTPGAETATSFFTLREGQPLSLLLSEQLRDEQDPATRLWTQVRILAWGE